MNNEHLTPWLHSYEWTAQLSEGAWKTYGGQHYLHGESSLDELLKSISNDVENSCNIRTRMFEVFHNRLFVGMADKL